MASIYAAQDPRGGKYGGPGYQLAFLHLHELQVRRFIGAVCETTVHVAIGGKGGGALTGRGSILRTYSSKTTTKQQDQVTLNPPSQSLTPNIFLKKQDQVNPHELSRRLEEVLVDAVNDVGVDLNKAVRPLYICLYIYLYRPQQGYLYKFIYIYVFMCVGAYACI